MKNLLQILFSAARAKVMTLAIKLRMWTSPAFLKSKVLVKIREFFTKLLDVKPRDKRDYYPVFRWLVSKRLAFALVVALGLVSALFISQMLPEDFLGGGSGIPTYKYRSIPLKFHTGTVNILARDGYVAYTGQVDKGVAVGQGILYAADGSTVYEGEFDNSMYNGTGTLFYPNGSPHYVGSFTDNVFDGTGTCYRPSGVPEYSGGYALGVRTGAGTLYDSVGDPVFQGNFLNDGIIYHEFLARPTGDIAQMYSGKTAVYQSDAEYCVTMPEIEAVYSVQDGSDTLENEWTVDKIYVLQDTVALESGTCGTVRELVAALGEPLYFGTAWVNLPEAVAWNMLAAEMPDSVQAVTIDAAEGLEDVYTVSGYDRDFQIYLYTFEHSGLVYTFYFTGAGESQFVMYAIEKA